MYKNVATIVNSIIIPRFFQYTQVLQHKAAGPVSRIKSSSRVKHQQPWIFKSLEGV